MNADNLLTASERKTIIERLVKHDKDVHKLTGKELKKARKLYSKWDDAKLMSVKFK